MSKQIELVPKEVTNDLWVLLKANGSLKIKGLGTFELRKIPGRKTYNPATKGSTYMNPYLKIKFRPITGLQRYINE